MWLTQLTSKYTKQLKFKHSKILLFLPLLWMATFATGRSSEDIVVIRPSDYNGDVGKFKKLELGLKLPKQINSAINDFLTNANANGINPFDPNQISVEATFTSEESEESYVVYGFFYRDFGRDLGVSDRWKSTRTTLSWRIRFAPHRLGKWKCSIRVIIPDFEIALYYTSCLEFTCTPSNNPGYLEIGQDGHHLRYSGTKESFFAIGQNIAWPLELAKNWETGRVSTKKFLNHNKAIKDLGDNSGNYFRLVMTTWGHAIEWEMLGNYYPRMSHAWELDKIFEIAESEHIYIHLCLEMQTSYNAAKEGDRPSVWGWEANPYNSANAKNDSTYSGVLNPSHVLSNAIARKYYQRRLRYIIARWGYSTSLGVLEFMNEQDQWDGFRQDTEMQKASVDWHKKMFDFIRDTLDHKQHLISTSYAGNPHKFRVAGTTGYTHPYDFMPVTNIHRYKSQKKSSFVFYKSMQRKRDGMIKGQWKDKPTIFGEIGMQAGAFQTGKRENVADIGDVESCDGVSFHNTSWSTAFMGGYGVGLYWWQNHNLDRKVANMPQLASFFKDVDFEKVNFSRTQKWRDRHLNINFKNECQEIGNLSFTREVFALSSKDRTQAIGWAHNATFYWGNTEAMTTCKDRIELTMELPCDDDKFTAPIIIKGKKIKIKGLKPWRKYTLEWYTTRTFGMLSSEVKRTSLYGKLKPRYPSDSEPDLAFKLRLNK